MEIMRDNGHIHRGLDVRSVCAEALGVHKRGSPASLPTPWIDGTAHYFSVCHPAELLFMVKITETLKRNASPEKVHKLTHEPFFLSIPRESSGKSPILKDSARV